MLEDLIDKYYEISTPHVLESAIIAELETDDYVMACLDRDGVIILRDGYCDRNLVVLKSGNVFKFMKSDRYLI